MKMNIEVVNGGFILSVESPNIDNGDDYNWGWERFVFPTQAKLLKGLKSALRDTATAIDRAETAFEVRS